MTMTHDSLPTPSSEINESSAKQWSPQQDGALLAVKRWLDDPNGPQIFRLFGYAGTGKTTLAKHFADSVDGTVLFAAFTGKAALVLRQKGCYATTLHSLIYAIVGETDDGQPIFGLNPESELTNADLLIVDECSMVNEELGNDVLSFGKKVLVLGDPFQLPPVEGAGFFTSDPPHIMLSEIHRQARDSAIIYAATKVREGEKLSFGTMGDFSMVYGPKFNRELMFEPRFDQVLCGRNKTRHSINTAFRVKREAKSIVPELKDKLVCLRNNHKTGLLNGSLWEAMKIEHREGNDMFRMQVKSTDGLATVPKWVRSHLSFFDPDSDAQLSPQQRRFYDEFTFGYALTCHKAQGSQWDSPLIFDESFCFQSDGPRWLYTAITRAAKRVTVVRGKVNI